MLDSFPQVPVFLRIEDSRVDRDLMPKMIEERPYGLLACLRRSLLQNGMPFPWLFGGTHIGQPRVLNSQETALLQVRLNDAPATAQILVETVLQQALHGLFVASLAGPHCAGSFA